MGRQLKDTAQDGWTLTPIHEEKEMHVHPNGDSKPHYESECSCNWRVDIESGYRIYNHERHGG